MMISKNMLWFALLVVLTSAACDNVQTKNEQTMETSVKEKIVTFPAKHISISIARPANEVYDFASNPENLPRWAAGLSSTVEKIDNEWVADSPMGKVRVRFASKNGYGILDHDVTLPSGELITNPMRAFPNNNGCEVVFSLYRLPGRTDDEYSADARTVEGDLKKLKALLEK